MFEIKDNTMEWETTSTMTTNSRITMNPPGFVPIFGQGLLAKEFQLGAVGTKSWLKAIKLHKYWPVVSHWTYWQMLSLTEENIDFYVKKVNATNITNGAKGKLLRSLDELRLREAKLKSLIVNLEPTMVYLHQALAYIMDVIHTPMPTSDDETLPILIIYAFIQVTECTCSHGYTAYEQKKLLRIKKDIRMNSVLRKAEIRLYGFPLIRNTALTQEKLDSTTSRMVAYVLQKRNRNCSEDSGFDECCIENNMQSIWPVGENTVMFGLQDTIMYRDLLKHSSFYSSKIADEEFDIEEHISDMVKNLL